MKPSHLMQIGVLTILGAWLGCDSAVGQQPGDPGSGGNASTTSSSATGGGGGNTTTSTTSTTSTSGTGGAGGAGGTGGAGGAGGAGGTGGTGGTGGAGGTGGTGGGISTTTTGTGGAGGADPCALGVPDPINCPTACSALYDCGALVCDGLAACQFSGSVADKATFVGDANGGCIQACTAQMAVINLVDPSDCATTIETFKGISAEFTDLCDNGTAGTGGAGGGTGAGGAGGGDACALGVPAPADCAMACAALYDCGALVCDGMAPCQFSGDSAEEAVFVGDAMSGCIEACTAQPLLISLVDPSDCASTIATIKSVSMEFTDLCDNGVTPP